MHKKQRFQRSLTAICFLLLCLDIRGQQLPQPNDPVYQDQDNLNNTGQNGGITDADIDAPEAWSLTTGVQNTVIAIIDSGVDLNHMDLQGRIWVNPGETPNNNMDDDQNGLVDDINGWNYGATPGNNNIQDIDGHGTAMAGVAAAGSNNMIDIAGVCWTCSLMILKDGDVAPTSETATRDSIEYAIANGADVINISTDFPNATPLIEQAIQNAHAVGIPVIAATGNDADNTIGFPAQYIETIAVGASDNRDFLWVVPVPGGGTPIEGSNTGPEIDLVAPGSDINMLQLGGGGIWTDNGTSQATATVSGVVGLIESLNPNVYGVEDFRALLRSSADKTGIGPFPTTEPSWNPQTGSGRLNAFHALNDSMILYDDVLPSAWYFYYIKYLSDEGIVQGFPDDTFRPGANVTRAETLKMAYEASGEPLNPSVPDPGYEDVNNGDWFYDYVADATVKGFVEGRPCSDGVGTCFFPNEPVNRAEATKIITEVFRVDTSDLEPVMNIPAADRTEFPDVPAGVWFHPYVYWMANSELRSLDLPNGIDNVQRIISGRPDGDFHPAALIDRAEMSKIITNTKLYFETGSVSNLAEGQTIFASIGSLYSQIFDGSNPSPPERLQLVNGNQQVITDSITISGSATDEDGDQLFYFWNATGGSFSSTDNTYSTITWQAPQNAMPGDIYNVNVVRGDARGYVGKGTFYFIIDEETTPPGDLIAIDIKPGSDTNPINPNSNGKIPVAILSSADFDAPSQIVLTSLTFGRTGAEDSLHYRGNGDPNCSTNGDHNSDGLPDVKCHFHTQIAGFQAGDTQGFLRGETVDGDTFEASDLITIVGGGNDEDADGVDDDTEDAAPNNGDGNGDGVLDSTQLNVTSLPSARGGYLSLVSSPDCTNTSVTAVSATDLPGDAGYEAPEGFLSFQLQDCNTSDTMLYIHSGEDFSAADYRRYGPTSDTPADHWYTLPADFGTVEIDGSTVSTASFLLVDGGLGDDDGTVNGTIIDPGGPAIRGMPVLEIPAASELGLLLLALLLSAGAMVMMRRR